MHNAHCEDNTVVNIIGSLYYKKQKMEEKSLACLLDMMSNVLDFE